MSEVSISESPATLSRMKARPYARSWLDVLIAWIIRLPGPSWLAYVALLAVAVLVNSGVQWLDGLLPFGVFDRARVAETPLLISFLPLTHYLDHVAANALSKFRSLLKVSDDQYFRLNYELTTLPRRLGWLSLVIGVALAAMTVLADPASWGLSESSSLFLVASRGAIATVVTVLGTAFFFRTIRQLRMVSSLQRMPARISLFQPGPVYAFSSLTARTGIGIVIFIYYYAFIAYGVKVFGPLPPISLVDLSAFGIMLLTAAASFVIPLLGMHERLVDEKSRALYEVNKRIELMVGRLHDEVDSAKLESADALNKHLASLLLEADTLSKVSTWPWQSETLRGFLGAITLPVLVWLITTGLGRFLTG